MARKLGRDDAEASQFSRREYLYMTGVLAGSIGWGAGNVTAGTAEPPIDVISQTVRHASETVELSNTYAEPVVVAGPVSYQGPQPASSRVRNVTETTFDLSVEEWLYLDGAHRYETVGSVVTESGVYDLPDDTTVDAGKVTADHRWVASTFTASFSETPIVFSEAQTVRGPQPIVTRHRNASRSGFDVRLQEEEARGAHRVEEIGYLAVEPGAGTLGGHSFEAGVKTGVGHAWDTVTFDSSYDQPVLLADMQTCNGANTATVRYRNLTGSSVEVKVEEERSGDKETAHLGEDIGYLVVDRKVDETTHDGYGADGYGAGGFGQ